MSETKIRRDMRSVGITLSTSTSVATTVRVDDIACGSLHIGTMNTNATTIQVFSAPSEAGTFSRLYTFTGVTADILLAPSTSATRAYTLPDAVYGAGWVKFVSGSTHTEGMAASVIIKS